MLKGFRDFAMRGNVIDLAVAVVIGTAFTALVTAITDALIQPMVNLFLGGGVDGGKLIVSGQVFDFGGVVNAIINFLIIAGVLYFVIVMPVKRIMEMTSRGEAVEETPAPTDEAILLAEIRDLLRDSNTDRP
jgi:large conductance mechanosensitive channel